MFPCDFEIQESSAVIKIEHFNELFFCFQFQNLPVELGNGRWSCPQCSKIMASYHSVKRHFIIHTGEKPFNCNHCEYNCNEKFNLQRHIRTKHNSE